MVCRLKRNLALVLLTSFAAASIGACVAGGGTPPALPAAVPGALAVSPPSAALPAGFALSVDPATYLDAAGARVTGAATTNGDELEIAVAASAALGLKALYFELSYDPAVWHPVAARASGRLAGAKATGAADGLLELAVLDQPGVVHHGQVLAHPEDQPGFMGDGVLARVYFVRGPATGTRRASSPPTGTNSAPVLAWDGGPSVLGWEYANDGDYNQDGLVTIADITPLAQHLNADVSEELRPESAASQADGDHNGLVTISDITPIGANFGHSALGGFRVYAGDSQEVYPADPRGANGPGAILVDSLALADAALGPPEHRRWFRLPVTPDSIGMIYWVRAVDEDGNEGISSNACHASSLRLPTVNLYPASVQYNSSTASYEWYYDNPGDFDQDGLVQMSDHAVLAAHLGELGPFVYASIESVVDANHDQFISINDVIINGQNFGSCLPGYYLYISSDVNDYPETHDQPSKIQPAAFIPFTAAQGDPTVERLFFQLPRQAPQAGEYYWVRPTIPGLGLEGYPSPIDP